MHMFYVLLVAAVFSLVVSIEELCIYEGVVVVRGHRAERVQVR